MKKFVLGLLAAAALFAALAAPAFAFQGNTPALLSNGGKDTATCVNNNATHANNHNQGGVLVDFNGCEGG